MREGRVDAITLHTVPYRDRDRIVKLFSKEEGVISLMVKGVSPKKPHLLALSSPLVLAHLVYKEGKSDLHLLSDAKIGDSFLKLRKDLATLNAACEMGKAILSSQLPGKAAPQLFALFKAYLEKIPSFEKPETLASSFLLKLLMHDGHLHLQRKCQQCDQEALFLDMGESLCIRHRGPQSLSFTRDEWESLFILTFSKKFSEIKEIPCSVWDKAQDLFRKST